MPLSNKINVKQTNKGKAMFAIEDLEKNEIIVKIKGNIINHSTNTSLQIDNSKHIEHSLKEDSFANHSCNPNGYINFNDLAFRSLKDIKKGEEITFNYLTTELNMNNPFECLCKNKNCFNHIKGFKYLSLKQKRSINHLSPFLKKKLKESN